MQKIDTDYKALSEIDPKVVQFYAEDKRTRTTGYTEDEEPKPIIEEYTVIILNKPDQVDYEYVESRKGRRHPVAVVMAALEAAITWEEFYFNHDLYLAWVADYAKWKEEQPTEEITNEDGTTEAVVLPAPELRAIDLSDRRAHYTIKEVTKDTALYHILPGFDLTYDDDALITTKTYKAKKKTSAELKAETDCKRRSEAKAYLTATDYIAARMAEGGEPMPQDVKEKRAKAREVLNGSYIEPHIESFYP